MRFLIKMAKVVISLVAGATTSLLGCVGLRKNYQVARQTYKLSGERLQCGQGWWDKLNKQRYGVTMQYVMLTTIGTMLITVVGIPELATGGDGRLITIMIGFYSCISGALFYLSPEIFRSWLNDLNYYCRCGENKNSKDYFGNTKLHRAIYRQDIAKVQEFLKEEPDLTIQNDKNDDNEKSRTALDLAHRCTLDKVHMNEDLSQKIMTIIFDTVSSEIVNRWKVCNKSKSIKINVGSDNVLPVDIASIVSSYLFDEYLSQEVPKFVQYSTKLKSMVLEKGKDLIFSEICRVEMKELQSKNRDAAIAIDCDHDGSIIEQRTSSNGYALLGSNMNS